MFSSLYVHCTVFCLNKDSVKPKGKVVHEGKNQQYVVIFLLKTYLNILLNVYYITFNMCALLKSPFNLENQMHIHFLMIKAKKLEV